MEKFVNFDYIECNTEKIRNMILKSLENTGFAAVVSDRIEGKYYIQVIQKSQ